MNRIKTMLKLSKLQLSQGFSKNTFNGGRIHQCVQTYLRIYHMFINDDSTMYKLWSRLKVHVHYLL